MTRIARQHEHRLPLALELHARPFPEANAPGEAVHLAFKPPGGGADEDPAATRAHLRRLLDLHGAPHPAPDADHHVCALGRATLKWERHTEFATYTLFLPGLSEAPFDGAALKMFPQEWLDAADGSVIAAAAVRMETVESEEAAEARLDNGLGRHFASESLAAASVGDGAAIVASDFRVDEDGFTRFAVILRGDVPPAALGRMVQRLLEIETYRAMSMLALPIARAAIRRASELDRELAALARGVAEEADTAPETLDSLTRKSAEVERLGADSAFRFGAARAYEAIVRERIEALNETPLRGRQTIGEFMQRRYDPAMRTCKAAELRLEQISHRAMRIADLLRTRVDVSISIQNGALLASMDRRADLQLRLQETVEGFSVVAISYYAVGLVGNLMYPFAEETGISKGMILAVATPPVVVAVWVFVNRLRRRAEDRAG